MKLWIGSNKINPMIGGNVTEKWREETNRVIATNLVENVASLLDGEIQYSVLLDHKGVLKRRVSITYAHEEEK